jgi:hypothetical protein
MVYFEDGNENILRCGLLQWMAHTKFNILSYHHFPKFKIL